MLQVPTKQGNDATPRWQPVFRLWPALLAVGHACRAHYCPLTTLTGLGGGGGGGGVGGADSSSCLSPGSPHISSHPKSLGSSSSPSLPPLTATTGSLHGHAHSTAHRSVGGCGGVCGEGAVGSCRDLAAAFSWPRIIQGVKAAELQAQAAPSWVAAPPTTSRDKVSGGRPSRRARHQPRAAKKLFRMTPCWLWSPTMMQVGSLQQPAHHRIVKAEDLPVGKWQRRAKSNTYLMRVGAAL